jgi:hypothetical protein
VPAEFRRIIGKALSKDREERYRTAGELLNDLKSLKEEFEFAQKLERSKPPHADLEASLAPDVQSAPTRRGGGRRVFTFALAAVVLASEATGAVLLWPRGESSSVTSAPASAPPAPAAERAVSYWITVQKYRGGKPFEEPFRLRDDINFEKDYRIRLHVASPQSGLLYLLNEGRPRGAKGRRPSTCSSPPRRPTTGRPSCKRISRFRFLNRAGSSSTNSGARRRFGSSGPRGGCPSWRRSKVRQPQRPRRRHGPCSAGGGQRIPEGPLGARRVGSKGRGEKRYARPCES